MIKRYQRDIWLHRRKPFMACPTETGKVGTRWTWGLIQDNSILQGKAVTIPDSWRVRARKGGDRIRLLPNGHSVKLKQLFQAAIVPPWLRSGIPLLEWDGEPVALGDWVIGPRLKNWLFENDLEYNWRPADPMLVRVKTDCQR